MARGSISVTVYNTGPKHWMNDSFCRHGLQYWVYTVQCVVPYCRYCRGYTTTPSHSTYYSILRLCTRHPLRMSHGTLPHVRFCPLAAYLKYTVQLLTDCRYSHVSPTIRNRKLWNCDKLAKTFAIFFCLSWSYLNLYSTHFPVPFCAR